MEYKNQHSVTAGYLEAWCDPNTPEEYEPYVWLVSKKTRDVFNKPPRKIFSETDFYTVYDSEGQRILELEKELQKVETKFISLRRDKLNNRKPITPEDRNTIATFFATMLSRVKLQRDEQREMWQELLDEVDKLPEGISTQWKETPKYKRIIMLRDQPMPFHLRNFVNIVAPSLCRMSCEILETKTKPGFITSDNPCFLFDPAIFTSNPPREWVSLFNSPTVEIILPISPRQVISLKPRGHERYFSLDNIPETVDEINKLIAENAEEYIVLNQKQYKDDWFG